MPMHSLEDLLRLHQMQQMQQGGGMMQRPPMPQGMPQQMPPQPQDSAVTGVGPMPQMNAPWGSQVKDYLAAGAGALGGAGMAAGMGQGIARPLAQGLGGAFARSQQGSIDPALQQIMRQLGLGAQGNLAQGMAQRVPGLEQIMNQMVPGAQAAGNQGPGMDPMLQEKMRRLQMERMAQMGQQQFPNVPNPQSGGGNVMGGQVPADLARMMEILEMKKQGY